MHNYNIEDLNSGDETDDDEAPRKKIPDWAQGNVNIAMENMDTHSKRRKKIVSFWVSKLLIYQLILMF